MKKRIKKAFTLVELLVVIAILAVLSTVAIVGYNSFTEKAKMSADQQAVTQMNRLLTAADVNEDFDDIFDVITFLDDESLDIEDYKPLTKDTYFYWLKDKNIIVHVDGDNEVIYPKDVTLSSDSELISLSGDVPVSDDYDVADDGTVTIDNGAELAHLIDAVNTGKETVTEITLSNDVDLRGAAVDFGTTTTDITINGNGHALKGLRADDNTVSPTSGIYAGHSYGFGIFGNIESGTVTIENMTISNVYIGNSGGSHEKGANTVGLVAGYVSAGAKLVMNNVTFKDCSVMGYQKVGGLVGQLLGTLELENVKFVNTTISAYLQGAKIAGIVGNNDVANLTVKDGCDFTGITVKGLAKNQLKTSDFTIENNFVLPSDHDDNIFCVDTGNEGTYSFLYGVVTNDWAWYHLTKVNPSYTLNNRPKVTVPGTTVDYIEGFTASASTNFVAGAPVK